MIIYQNRPRILSVQVRSAVGGASSGGAPPPASWKPSISSVSGATGSDELP